MNNAPRLHIFDNIKALLIFLVIAVHLLAPIVKSGQSNAYIDTFMLLACAFHMPLFFFISGYFSKPEKSARRAFSILVMYLLAQLILYGIEYFQFGITPMALSNFVFAPAFSLWYLIVLFLFVSFLPIFARLRGWIVIPIAAVLSVVIMIWPEQVITMKFFSNAIYFMLGYYCNDRIIHRIRSVTPVVYLMMWAFAVYGSYSYVSTHEFNVDAIRSLFLRSYSYQEGGLTEVQGAQLMTAVLFFVIYISVATIGLMPNKRSWISTLGKNTITIYIAQAIIYLEYTPIISESIDNGTLDFTTALQYAFGLSLLTMIVFGNKYVAWAWNKLIQGIVFIFTKKQRSADEPPLPKAQHNSTEEHLPDEQHA